MRFLTCIYPLDYLNILDILSFQFHPTLDLKFNTLIHQTWKLAHFLLCYEISNLQPCTLSAGSSCGLCREIIQCGLLL